MKISENQIVTGMFVFDPSSEYTVNDFVIKDGIIYICIKDVIGEEPKNSDSFVVYLGDQSMDLSEYLEFLETSEGENKYISVGMLQAVLSTYMLGPTGKGVIGDYIYYEPDTYNLSLRIPNNDGIFTNPETVLSDIMVHPDINHCMLRVSRLLPEIYGYVGNPGISDYTGEDQKSCILKQYTYLQEGTNHKIRLQELIDPVDGLIWYRSLNTSSGFGIAGDTWKCSVVNSRALKEKAEAIINMYNSRLKVIRSLENHLKSNFRYRKLELAGTRVTTVSYRTYGVQDESYLDHPGELTFVISDNSLGGKFVRNHEVTINLSDKLGDSYPEYLVGDSLKLVITYSGDYMITLKTKNGGSVSNAWISSVYYKEYYGVS